MQQWHLLSPAKSQSRNDTASNDWMMVATGTVLYTECASALLRPDACASPPSEPINGMKEEEGKPLGHQVDEWPMQLLDRDSVRQL